MTVVTLPLEAAHARGPLTAERAAASTAFGAMERLAGVRAVFPDAPAVSAAGSTIEEGHRAGTTVLDVPISERPSAVVAQSDLLAVGVLRAAEDLGIAVPGELSVVGFDGIRTEGATAQVLTTLVQPAVEKGRLAAEAVLAALAGEPARPAQLRSELRIGTTTGPASPS